MNTLPSSPLAASGPGHVRNVLAGALALFLGHPNPVLHLPGLVLFAPFFLYLVGTGKKGAIATFVPAWLMGGLGYSLCLYWLYQPMTYVGNLPLFLVVPSITLLGLYLGLFTGAAALCIRAWHLPFGQSRWKGLFLVPLFSSLAFGGLELASAWLFTGFPWLTLSTSFAPWPLLVQGASVVGVYGLSTLYALVAFFCAAGCRALCESSERADSSGFILSTFSAALPFAAALLLFALIVFFGETRLGLRESLKAAAEPDRLYTFGMVQGNVDQNQKWNPEFQHGTVKKYLALSEDLIRKGKESSRPLDMLIWPETAMPIYYNSSDPYDTMLQLFTRKHALPLGFGTLGFDRTAEGELSLYNRFQGIDHEGMDSGHYDKQHLVPFGEYIPFLTLFSFLQDILQGMSFTPGGACAPLKILPASEISAAAGNAEARGFHGKPLSLGVLICYEAIFPELARQRVADGATVLVNVTNDAWFGLTSAPYQHLSLAAMRAVEQKRPILRSTNTGITALIDAYGRVTQAGPLFVDDTALVTVQPEHDLTLFHDYADYIDALLLLGILLALCLHLKECFGIRVR